MALARRIVPCLDVKDGKVVKGVKFVDLRVIDDPVTLSRRYDEMGADELVLLDISASVEGRALFLHVVEEVAETVFIPFATGGGVRSLEDIRAALQRGADKVSINTAAVSDPDLIDRAAEAFGSSTIVVAIDARRLPKASPAETTRWEVVTHGGRTPTGRDLVEWAAEVAKRGAGEILLTSMDADGTQKGYDVEQLRAVGAAAPIPLIASGGAGELSHFRDALVDGEADAVLAASVFHDGVYTVDQVKDYLEREGVPIRRERLARPPLRPPWGDAGAGGGPGG